MRIGVLAFQGDFSKHIEALRSLHIEGKEVRQLQDLHECEGLIIPGGESTAMLRQLDFIQMRQALLAFAKQHPVFGTCAGLILMSSKVEGLPFDPLQLLDIEVERNAFGRQIESFHATVFLELIPNQPQSLSTFFIRAPRIKTWGPSVNVLAQWQGEPVLVQQGNHLGASFHPELTKDTRIHQYFIEMVRRLSAKNYR